LLISAIKLRYSSLLCAVENINLAIYVVVYASFLIIG
jgi:hypothetical protein